MLAELSTRPEPRAVLLCSQREGVLIKIKDVELPYELELGTAGSTWVVWLI
jgi:hypothetical protein